MNIHITYRVSDQRGTLVSPPRNKALFRVEQKFLLDKTFINFDQ
mgnify:CR=1 FL=1